LLALASLAACATAPRPLYLAAPASAGELDFRPAEAAADRYGQLTPAVEDSALGNALADAVLGATAGLGMLQPLRDGRLDYLARDLAGIVALGVQPPFAAVELAQAHHGIAEPTLRLISVRADPARPELAAAAASVRLDELLAAAQPARFGVGMTQTEDGVAYAVLALLESAVDLAPLPRRLPARERTLLRATLRPPYHSPVLAVTRGDGQVERTPLVATAGAIAAELVCGAAPERQQVELLADGPRGLTVLANFPVFCAEEPPRSVRISLAPPTYENDTVAAEQRLLVLANLERARAGRPALRQDARAATIARLHSVEMEQGGWVAHDSPITGNPADRARAGGVRTPLVLENVARATSSDEVHAALLGSPGHRGNLLSADATHVGIGVVLGDGALYVTQLFFRVPPLLELSRARADAAAALARARVVAGGPALVREAALDALAQRAAVELADRPDARAAVMLRVRHALEDPARGLRHAVTVVTVVGDVADVPATARAAAADFRLLGIGLAQGDDPDLGPNAIFVVLVLAR
ncbi:MAG: CAP domain-containing protein, partial [Myxococcales bacterium]|nr:CAP domain-containing protein [Myxococcales bacterium]